MLQENDIKEALSIAYVRAVCGMAGYLCEKPEKDYGIDITIKDVMRRPSGRCVVSGRNIDIQVKATTTDNMNDSVLKYSLRNKNYNDLIDTEAGTVRILVVLILPKDKNTWLNQDANSLVMKKCAYWMYLKGMEPKTNEDSTTTLEIPIRNVFSVKRLQSIMEQVKNSGDISEPSN